MLTREDLQAIGQLVRQEVRKEIAASEERMIGRIAESEERMIGRMDQRIAESEERMATRMDQRFAESETRLKTDLMAYIESSVKPDIHKIAEGHMQLSERMERMEGKIDRLQDDVDEIKGALVAQELMVKHSLDMSAKALKAVSGV